MRRRRGRGQGIFFWRMEREREQEKKNTKLVRSSLRLLPLPPDTDGEKVSGSFSWLVSIVMRIQDKWRGTDEEETMRGRKELIEGEKKQIQQRGVAVEEVKGGRRRAQREGNIGGTSSSDMDPQDFPLETATFRGTWESHRWKGRALAVLFFLIHFSSTCTKHHKTTANKQQYAPFYQNMATRVLNLKPS